MDLDDLIRAFDAGDTITAGSPLSDVMHAAAQAALRVTGELNGSYHEPSRVRELLGELTARPIHDTITLFPPFRADFGRNIRLGERVFINSGCVFQDQGGITIGDDCQIGPNTVIATLNHDLAPGGRADVMPRPVVLGRNVWTGGNATILPGVTIGDDAVIGAGAVVTKDVPAGAVVGGVPARIIRSVYDRG